MVDQFLKQFLGAPAVDADQRRLSFRIGEPVSLSVAYYQDGKGGYTPGIDPINDAGAQFLELIAAAGVEEDLERHLISLGIDAFGDGS